MEEEVECEKVKNEEEENEGGRGGGRKWNWNKYIDIFADGRIRCCFSIDDAPKIEMMFNG